MKNCPDTGIAIPECCCSSCLERQLDQFAPGKERVQRMAVHDPLLLRDVRSPAQLPPVLERLTRPAL